MLYYTKKSCCTSPDRRHYRKVDQKIVGTRVKNGFCERLQGEPLCGVNNFPCTLHRVNKNVFYGSADNFLQLQVDNAENVQSLRVCFPPSFFKNFKSNCAILPSSRYEYSCFVVFAFDFDSAGADS